MRRFYSRISGAFIILLLSNAVNAQVSNYTFTASSGTFTPIAGGTPVATSTSVADFLGDTKTSVAIPIGFTFKYDNVNYTQVVAVSDGFLSFNTAATSTLTNNLATSATTRRPLLAPLWDDLDGASGSGAANYITTGTPGSRIFTIEWLNWQWNWNATGATISFQVKLYEGTNVVEFIYRQESGAVNSPSASIGITGAGTGAGNFLSLNNSSASPTVSSTTETTNIATKPATGQIYRFTPPNNCTGSPTAGTTVATPGTTCYGGSITLSLSGNTTGVSNIDYQWQYAPIATSTWTDIPGATSQSYVFTPPGSYQYRAKVTCTASGLSDFSSPLAVSVSNIPTYAAFPYSQDFESWVDGCSTTDRPDVNWSNSPATGNNSWRRDDQQVSASWGNPTNGTYTPAFTTGAHSARFHSYQAASGEVGNLDLFINLSTDPTPTKFLRFDYINTSGTDVLKVLLSTDGGLTFSQVGANLGVQNGWATKSFSITSSSATTVIRLQATSDFGTTDIGVDNLSVANSCNGSPVAGTTVATPSTTCLGGQVNLTLNGNTTNGTGITYQWQYAPIATSTWTDIPGANSASYLFAPPGSYQYRAKVTCTTSGLTDFSSPLAVSVSNIPSYAAFPYTQDFESWIDGCSTTDRPGVNWSNSPATGNNSWRRDDQQASASWVNPTSGTYTPAFTTGAHSARFHSYQAASGQMGNLDLFIDLSTDPTPTKILKFDYINTSGTDVLKVFVSTDGGFSFTQVGANLGVQGTWGTKTFGINSTSATTVIRLQATSDFGTTDIGVDNLSVIIGCIGTPVAGTASANPSTLCYGGTSTLSVTGATSSPGITYQWQSSANGGTTWNNIPGATNTTYLANNASLQYRVVVTCINGGGSANSNAVTLTTVFPTYATIPYFQGFESWINGCSTTDRPDASWGNIPPNSDSSWRRDDQGASASWTGLTLGGYTPAFTEGAHSARFHSYEATNGTSGILDLFVNLSTAAGDKQLKFDYINTSGNDSLVILLSTNGGATFTRLDSLKTRAAWFTKVITISSNSPTAVIRFKATSDFGVTDIGVDNLFILTTCNGVPAAGTVSAPGGVGTICPGNSLTLSVSGQTQGPGIGYLWQSSTDNVNWTNIASANGTSYVASPTVNTYYRIRVICNNTADTSNSNSLQLVVVNPQVTGTTSVTRCGPGSVPLSATGSPGTIINWYTAATGGMVVGSGNTFNTPIISSTTTYYAAALEGNHYTVGLAADGTNCGTRAGSTATDWPLRFNTTAPVTLNAVTVVPQAAATFTVALRNALSATNLQTATFTFTAAQVGVPQQISLGFSIPTPGNYQITNTTGGVLRIGTFTCAYPFTSPTGNFSIVGSATSSTSATNTTTYNSFYSLDVVEGCVSPRVAVTATISPAPAFTITPATTICSGASKALSVTSPLSNFDTYSWSPATNLYTDATALTPYVAGTSASTVYVKNTVSGTYTYVATANNTSTSCQNIDSVKVTVLPSGVTIDASSQVICVSGPTTLSLNPSTGYTGASVQWYVSTNGGSSYTLIPAATGFNYTTPTLTANTMYKAVISDAAGNACEQPTIAITVNDPQVLTTTPGARCGPGTVNLAATSSSGTILNWFTAPSGGTLVATGNSFTTPSLNATTTYYVSAFQSSGSFTAGRVAPLPTSTGSAGDEFGLVFNATKPFVLNSVDIYSTSTTPGSITVQLTNSAGTVLLSAGPFVIPVRTGSTVATGATPTTIPLGFDIPVGTGYRLRSFNHTGNIIRDNPIAPNYSYPLPIGTVGSITSGLASGATSATSYYYFFNWQVATGCTSARTAVTATVSGNTTITAQPTNIATCAGAPVTFTVAATGANLTYQWKKGTQNITNATSASYTINAATVADAGDYSVVVTGLCGTQTSTVATLTVAATNSWLGAVSNDWSNPANWCGSVPTAISDIVIPAGTPFQPQLSVVGDVHNLTINAGASVTVTSTGFLNVYGNVANAGTFNASSGVVAFRGTSNQTVNGLTAGTVLINGAGVTLTGNMTVGTALILTNGNITLGTNTLTLNTSSNGSAASHIITNGTGSVVSNNINAGPVVIPVGPDAASYNPVIISSGQGRNYTVRVATGILPTINNPGRAVNRTWNITPSSVPSAPVSILLQYSDADVNTNGSGGIVMEVGVHNGTSWNVVSSGTGVTPSGLADARQVGLTTTQFGPFVVANFGGITFPTAIAGVDPDVTSIMVMPNPVQSSTVLRVQMRRAMKVYWTIIDNNGRIVMTMSRQMTAGRNDITLQVPQLAAGMYHILGATEKGKTRIVRFVKQ